MKFSGRRHVNIIFTSIKNITAIIKRHSLRISAGSGSARIFETVLIQCAISARREKSVGISSPRDSRRHILMLVERRKRYIRPANVPHVYAAIDDESATRNMVFPLRSPFDSAYRCYRMDCKFQHGPHRQIPHLDRFVSACGGEPRALGMPIARENRTAVRRKLLLTLIRPSYVPQLNISVL